MKKLKSRIFTEAEQIKFAQFSGDVNPIHMSELEARKSISGQRIVHGIHGMLWALDVLSTVVENLPVDFQCKFIKPIFLNEEVLCTLSEDKHEVVLSVANIMCTKIIIQAFGEVTPVMSTVLPVKDKSAARVPSASEFVKDLKTPFVIHGTPSFERELFPSLSRRVGNCVVCEIGALSTFVGMDMPGRYSMLSGLKVIIGERDNVTPEWTIENYDERFNRLKLAYNTTNIRGTIDAFHFPQSEKALSDTGFQEINIINNEFVKVNALVVGGSRGLGNAVARMLCAGGAKVTITYNNGKLEAEKFQQEMISNGMSCNVVELSVDDEIGKKSSIKGFNQVYYFASPKIFDRKPPNFDNHQYKKFYKFYVTYFQQLCQSIVQDGDLISVFYPSSVAAENVVPGMEEYGKAKSLGEILCEEINSSSAGRLKVIYPRLPRLDTDQTVSIVPVKNNDPYRCMIDHIREMGA